jgi:hypothetical protein
MGSSVFLAEQQRRGAYLGLAAAAALIVLVASGVAVDRMASDDADGQDRPRLAGPTNQPPGSTTSPGSVAAAAVVTPPVDASADALRSRPSAAAPASAAGGAARRIDRSARTADGTPDRASAAATSTTGAAGPASGGSDGPAAPPGSGSTGSPASPEAPPTREGAPESAPLLAASVSAGQGDQGGVVGVGLADNPDADVTVGTTPVVGDAPPSHGTGIGLGGQLLHPPPTIPVLPG